MTQTTITKPTRGELLDHYSRREPKAFVQLDCHVVRDDDDDVMRADEDGHCLMSSLTFELMHACAVRVLILPDTTQDDAARTLRQIADWIDAGALSQYLPLAIDNGVSDPIPFCE